MNRWLKIVLVSPFCLIIFCYFTIILSPLIFNIIYPIENGSPATSLKFIVEYRNAWYDLETKLSDVFSSKNQANYYEKLQNNLENKKTLEFELETFSKTVNNATLKVNAMKDPKELRKLLERLGSELDHVSQRFSGLIATIKKSLAEENEKLDAGGGETSSEAEVRSFFARSRFWQHVLLLSNYGYDLHSSEINFRNSQKLDQRVTEVLNKFLSLIENEEQIQFKIRLLSDKINLPDKEYKELEELKLRSEDYKNTIKNFYNENKYTLSCTYSNTAHLRDRVSAYNEYYVNWLTHTMEIQIFIIDIAEKFDAVSNDCGNLLSELKNNVNHHQEL